MPAHDEPLTFPKETASPLLIWQKDVIYRLKHPNMAPPKPLKIRLDQRDRPRFVASIQQVLHHAPTQVTPAQWHDVWQSTDHLFRQLLSMDHSEVWFARMVNATDVRPSQAVAHTTLLERYPSLLPSAFSPWSTPWADAQTQNPWAYAVLEAWRNSAAGWGGMEPMHPGVTEGRQAWTRAVQAIETVRPQPAEGPTHWHQHARQDLMFLAIGFPDDGDLQAQMKAWGLGQPRHIGGAGIRLEYPQPIHRRLPALERSSQVEGWVGWPDGLLSFAQARQFRHTVTFPPASMPAWVSLMHELRTVAGPASEPMVDATWRSWLSTVAKNARKFPHAPGQSEAAWERHIQTLEPAWEASGQTWRILSTAELTLAQRPDPPRARPRARG
jgi:hypothetical protein